MSLLINKTEHETYKYSLSSPSVTRTLEIYCNTFNKRYWTQRLKFTTKYFPPSCHKKFVIWKCFYRHFFDPSKNKLIIGLKYIIWLQLFLGGVTQSTQEIVDNIWTIDAWKVFYLYFYTISISISSSWLKRTYK